MRTIIEQLPDRGEFLIGKRAIEIGYPWLSCGAIIAVEEMVKPEHNVLEFGCGGSTVFFSRRCNKVKSYETSSEWAKRVEPLVGSNVTLICEGPVAIVNRICEEPDSYYDWLIIDSEDFGDKYKYRRVVMESAIPKLKVGGFMVVDNYERGHLASFDFKGWDVYTFDDFEWVGRGTKICIKQ